MSKLSENIKSADWKTEKHVPVIECADAVKAEEMFPVKVTLGKEVAHPNTTEHHIRWVSLYFLPEGGKAPFHVGTADFAAHGESVEGANQGPVYTHHEATFGLKVKTSGTLFATAYCNIHGVWESAREIRVS